MPMPIPVDVAPSAGRVQPEGDGEQRHDNVTNGKASFFCRSDAQRDDVEAVAENSVDVIPSLWDVISLRVGCSVSK